MRANSFVSLLAPLLALTGRAAALPTLPPPKLEPASSPALDPRLLPAAGPVPAPATLEERAAVVEVAIDSSNTVMGSVLGGIESFKGIPYAEAPVGDLRMRPPRRRTAPLGKFDASMLIPPSCPQMFFSTEAGGFLSDVLGNLLNTGLFQKVTGATEDCLNINVQRPVGVKAGDKLPVLFWIFGGGFELGSTAMYDGTALLQNGVNMKQPFIFVAVNYRTGGFGFMPGSKILAEGSANAGLLDQRMGLEWTADNIAAFGGDPDKVTIWGESAGAISVFDQMALFGGDINYKGKKLFRAAIMNSGSLVPADPLDCPKGEKVFGQVVKSARCDKEADQLACLRKLPYKDFLDAANSVPGILSYNSVALSYLPRPDGKVLPKSPDQLVLQRQYAAVPMIIGDQEDEGTLFSLFQPNVTSSSRLVEYLGSIFFQNADKKTLEGLVDTYHPFLTEGSPFRTGILNEIYPGFKRLAAILGDLVFTLTRRIFLTGTNILHPDVPSWSYLSSYDYGTPILGTFHGSDLLQVFYGILPNYASRSTMAYYTNFLYNLDPNVGTGKYMYWPKWSEKQQLMHFFDDKAELLADNFREDSYNFIFNNSNKLYI